IHGKVTRFSPFVQEKDRTMLVEVDLYNGTPKDYQKFLAAQIGGFLAPIGQLQPLDALVANTAARRLWAMKRKQTEDPLPLYPKFTGDLEGIKKKQELMPGMYGTMRLQLQRFQDCYLLPSSAVLSRGGKRYIALVQDGKVHFAPVKVQVDDGTLVKVALI